MEIEQRVNLVKDEEKQGFRKFAHVYANNLVKDEES